ncbi:MAG TPA: hypothetical protein PKD79_01710 [Candidatus Doudnabacteria bacterium]|nr:hypothetical protein [Candidatus Doudnabacteria bacterium]
MKMKIKNWLARGMVAILVLSGVLMSADTIQAASLTSMSDTLDRLEENLATNHTIVFVTPTGVSSGQTIDLTFAGFTSASVNAIVHGDVDFATAATCSGFTDRDLDATPSGATWGVSNPSSGVIRITSGTGTVTAGHCVQIQIGTHATHQSSGSNRIVNGAHATAHSVTIGGTFADSGTIAIDILEDDQVVITATVGPSISFAISDNTIGFGALDFSASRYANGAGTGDGSEVEAHTLSASTNASAGYIITVFGPTLTNGSFTITAIGGSNTSPAPGTEQFGVRFTASGGSGTVTAPYAASGFAYDGIASPDQVAGSTVATDTTTYSARYLANIDIDTEAGAYSTALTYTATATF